VGRPILVGALWATAISRRLPVRSYARRRLIGGGQDCPPHTVRAPARGGATIVAIRRALKGRPMITNLEYFKVSPILAARWFRLAPASTPARSSTPLTPPATTSGIRATSSAIYGRSCQAMCRSRPISRFRTRNGYGDRKAVLVIRQSLDDDAKEVVVSLHGAGMISLAQAPREGHPRQGHGVSLGGRGRPAARAQIAWSTVVAARLGIEKRGDSFALFVSLEGEPCISSARPPPAHRRALLRRHRLLLAPAGQSGYGSAFECGLRERRGERA